MWSDKNSKSTTIKWYNVHSWFLRGLLTAMASSYANVTEWVSGKNKRTWLKLPIFGACMIVSLVFYVKLNIDTHNTHELDSAQSPVFPCTRTPKEAKELLDLFHDVHEILNKLNIRHFLIYGSLWGAYRTMGPLPWDYDIDIAIIGEEQYAQIPKSDFVRPFLERGINVDDKTTLSSCYYLTRGDFAQVDIDIFYNYHGWMQRTGILTWLLYYNYQRYHKFPAWMAKEPLPKTAFADLTVAVPHGGKTILKYLYPNDWERAFTPAACRIKKKKSNSDSRTDQLTIQ